MVSVGEQSSLTDGFFEIFILKAKNPFSFFQEFLRILFGIKINNNYACYLKSKTLTIKNHWTACHVDGEKTKFKDDIKITVKPQVLKVFVL